MQRHPSLLITILVLSVSSCVEPTTPKVTPENTAGKFSDGEMEARLQELKKLREEQQNLRQRQDEIERQLMNVQSMDERDKLLAEKSALLLQIEANEKKQLANKSKDASDALRRELERAHRTAGETSISCKAGTEGDTTYIGCRWGGDSDAATVWYVEGSTVKALNGKALQMVSKLHEPWIQEGPRPSPPGVNVEVGLRATR